MIIDLVPDKIGLPYYWSRKLLKNQNYVFFSSILNEGGHLLYHFPTNQQQDCVVKSLISINFVQFQVL